MIPLLNARTRRERALSMIEIMLAMGVISIALLGIIAMYTQGLFLLSDNKQVARATELAQENLEMIKARGVALISSGVVYDSRNGDQPDPLTGFPPPPYNAGGNTEYPIVIEARKAQLRRLPTGVRVMAVTVRVYFEKDRYVELQTYFKR